MTSLWSDDSRPVREGEGLDAKALEAFLLERLPEAAGPLEIRQFPAGHSNLTYLVSTPDREFVLRRPPFGAKAIKAGHDMRREYRILSALHPAYGKAPRPLLFCAEEDSPIGAEFYLMERVQGAILRAPLPKGVVLDPSAMRAVSTAFVESLAALHAFEYKAAGLGDLGKPEGYVVRQVEGWAERYARAHTDEIPEAERVVAWLRANLPPEQPATLIHNDFKYDNLVLDPDNLSVVRAVLDWEMATIGDPLADLGTSLAYWIEADELPELRAIALGVTALPGNLTRAELVERYAAITDRDVSHIRFYRALGLFKVAVIAQQIYFRYRKGFTADPRFAVLGNAVRALLGEAANEGR